MKIITMSCAVFVSYVGATENRGDVRERIDPKGFLYGLGIGINQEPYKGYDRRTIPLPLIGYKGEKLTVIGPFVSYDLADFRDVKLSFQVSPKFQGFDETDSYIFEGMEKREFSIDAGIGLKYEKNNWHVSLSSMFDILNKSNGYSVKSSLGKAFRWGPVFVEPSLSLEYLDANHVNYYYGVNSNEVNEIRSAYDGSSTVNTTLGLSLATPVFFGGMTRLSVDHTWYGAGITDSPLVDTKSGFGFRLFYTRFF